MLAAPGPLRALASRRGTLALPGQLGVRFFSRDPEDGNRAKKPLPERYLEFRADDSRLRDGWSWVGSWEKSLTRTLRHAKKLTGKLQYPSMDPAGRAKREEQRRYWEKEAAK
ncbi:unnamed protein product [Polarella glacialis]|uniref:Uncharacterized protein n=1 Tax=Polarella glacialis TaxID=89957 RepID=A0A813IB37_POLGL|nr:unnamed protein product [Polarella glacialis]CAE8647968.1 unnamed protein product [Polarella glacialis]